MRSFLSRRRRLINGKATLVLALAFLVPAASAQVTWFKGNTHSHTELSGHADSSPEHVAKWYHDRGYNFLILSEHNRFIDPDSVTLPPNSRRDFILIPGEEITGRKVIHTTAMNVPGLVNWEADHEHKHVIVQSHVDSTLEAGGIPILNHPNYQWALTTTDIRPVERLHLFELHNGHPHVHNWGDSTHASTEQMWDGLLTDGMLIYGVSSDDAHDFKKWGVEVSNPGRGWVMVRAKSLTPEAITHAMRSGDFYASSGVILSEVHRGKLYHVKIDHDATNRELASPYLVGHHVSATAPGVEISFVGPGGSVLATYEGTEAEFPVSPDLAYVRAKVTARRLRSGGGYEAFYAWTQPFFNDERGLASVPPEPGESHPTEMMAAARFFLDTLTPEQRAKALYPFDAEERFNWHFIPRARNGLPLKEMSPEQRFAAHSLLQAALSARGYLKATGVISLEEVLRSIETSGPVRDQELYYVTLFGEPSEDAAWGWRFEGHHLSLNYSASSDELSVTPSFMGANPAQVRSGPRTGLRVLAAEEDLARRLVKSFSSSQRDRAVIAPDAPDDILTGTERRPRVGAYEGLSASEMSRSQRDLLRRLILEYAGNVQDAEERMAKIDARFDELHFAWAGGVEPGDRHYYRIHGPTVVFEYDNTQNGANHVHAVWRDMEDDFGADLLKRHYEEHEH